MLKLHVQKAKVKMFLRGYSVAMVTSCVGKKSLNCLMMIGNLYDTSDESTNENLWLY